MKKSKKFIFGGRDHNNVSYTKAIKNILQRLSRMSDGYGCNFEIKIYPNCFECSPQYTDDPFGNLKPVKENPIIHFTTLEPNEIEKYNNKEIKTISNTEIGNIRDCDITQRKLLYRRDEEKEIEENENYYYKNHKVLDKVNFQLHFDLNFNYLNK